MNTTLEVPTHFGVEKITGRSTLRFLVHPALTTRKPKGWTITHKASGRKLPRTFKTKADALRVAEELDPIPEFDNVPDPDEIPEQGFKKEEMQTLADKVRAVYDAQPGCTFLR